MEKITVTVRLDPETVAFLDQVAKFEERDRSYMIKRAVKHFIDLRRSVAVHGEE